MRRNQKTVIFTDDFEPKKKGEIYTCGHVLASTLVHENKVAEYYAEKPKKAPKDKE